MNNAAVALLLLGLCSVAQSQAVLERIKQRGQVTIGYRVDASPFSFTDKAGTPTGYSVELCQPMAAKLAQQAGLAPNAVRYLAVPVDQLERFVKAANVDLLCSATSDTPDRRKSMDFSAPVFVATVKLLVRKQDHIQSLEQLGGKAVAVIDRTTAAQAVTTYAAQKGVAVTLSRSVSPEAALGQLKLGWVAAYARDDVLMAMQLAGSPDAAGYSQLPDALSTENIAIGLPPGDAVLAGLVQQSLAEQAKSGAWAAAYERWFMKPIPPANQTLNLQMPDALKASVSQVR